MMNEVERSRLVKRCQQAMSRLANALERGNVSQAKRLLPQIEALYGNVPNESSFRQVRSALKAAVVQASFELDALEDSIDDSQWGTNPTGLFGGGSPVSESVHVDDIDLAFSHLKLD